jgi:hypothetical protein
MVESGRVLELLMRLPAMSKDIVSMVSKWMMPAWSTKTRPTVMEKSVYMATLLLGMGVR